MSTGRVVASSGRGSSSVSDGRDRLPSGALRRVCDYVEAHIEETVSLQVLAGIAGQSMHHFARTFKRSAGLPPHKYLMQCRVRRAQELLAATNLPLAQVALACGFADQSHLGHRFREQVGVTPRNYRWSMRRDDGRTGPARPPAAARQLAVAALADACSPS